MRPAVARLWFVLLLGLGGWQVEGDQAPTASAGVVPDTVTVGSPFIAIIRVSTADEAGVTAGMPRLGADIELTDSIAIEGGRAAGEWRIRYPLVAWQTGPLPEIRAPVTITSGDGTTRTFDISLALPFVASVLPDDTAGLEPRGPKGILDAPREGFPWWIPAVALVLLLAAVAIVWRRSSRSGAETPLTSASARDQALDELSSPELRRLMEQGAFGDAYTRISEIVRKFLREVDARWTLDLTTTELIGAMVTVGLPADLLARLESELVRLDQVKFARTIPSQAEAVALLDEVRSSVAGWK